MGETDFWANIVDLQRQIHAAGERCQIVKAGPLEFTLKKMGDWGKWSRTWEAWGGMTETNGQTCTFRG